MLEVRDRWQAKNLVDNQLPEVVQRWLKDIEHRAGELGWLPRFQFIRKRNPDDAPLTLMTCRNNVLNSAVFSDFDELVKVDPINDPFETIKEPTYFVCAHGSRDQCCSRLGLETWRQLERLTPGNTWQTTHLGGHRFAPNVLVLPTGRMYGRVYADRAEEFFESIESGSPAWEFARGNASLPKQAQVCESEILKCAGEYVAMSDTGIQYRTSNGLTTLPLPQERTLEVFTSCKDEEASVVKYYEFTRS